MVWRTCAGGQILYKHKLIGPCMAHGHIRSDQRSVPRTFPSPRAVREIMVLSPYGTQSRSFLSRVPIANGSTPLEFGCLFLATVCPSPISTIMESDAPATTSLLHILGASNLTYIGSTSQALRLFLFTRCWTTCSSCRTRRASASAASIRSLQALYGVVYDRPMIDPGHNLITAAGSQPPSFNQQITLLESLLLFMSSLPDDLRDNVVLNALQGGRARARHDTRPSVCMSFLSVPPELQRRSRLLHAGSGRQAE